MRYQRLIVFAAICGAAIALALLSSFVLIAPEVVLLTLLAIVLVLAVIARIMLGRLDVFDPLITFVLIWAVLFFARPVAMFVTGSFDVSTYHIRDGMSGMLWMALIGATGFLGAYAMPTGRLLGRRLRPLPEIRSEGRAKSYALAIAGVGVLLFGVFIALSGGLGTLQLLMSGRQENAIVLSAASTTAYLQGALVLTLPASLILFFVGFTRKSVVAVVLGILVALAGLVVTGPSGIRGWILPYVAAPFILFYLVRSKRPGFLLVLTLLLVGFGANGFIAQARESATRQTTSFGQLLSENFTQLGNAWDRFVLGGDTEMPNLLALEVLKVPSSIPFQNGAATGEVFLQPVPRQLWPAKPRSGDELLTQQLFVDPRLNTASRQYTPMANFYLDFGFVGVLIGMGLLGLGARVLYEYMRANLTNGSVQLLYAATLPFLFPLLRGSINDAAGRLVFIVPPLLLGILVARRRRESISADPWPEFKGAQVHRGGEEMRNTAVQ
jgi:hypothetical protein